VRSSGSLPDFKIEFSRKLQALARIQEILSRGEDAPIELEEIVRMELDPLADTARARIVMSGPRVELPRAAVQVLSLVLHELATNAVKHGALRDGDGALRISWEQKQNDLGRAVVCVRWTEQCEREQPPKAKMGFGRMLIEEAIPRQLGGKSVFSLQRNGLDCTIEVPLA
jgi:two-component system CheB/CheR fusion protein